MPKATDKQRHFLEILLNDRGYDTLVRRREFYRSRTNREVKFTDELTVSEASKMIEELKVAKEEQREEANFEQPPSDPWGTY